MAVSSFSLHELIKTAPSRMTINRTIPNENKRTSRACAKHTSPGQSSPVCAHTIGRETDLIQVYSVNKISLENDDLSDETTTTDRQPAREGVPYGITCHIAMPSTRPELKKTYVRIWSSEFRPPMNIGSWVFPGGCWWINTTIKFARFPLIKIILLHSALAMCRFTSSSSPPPRQAPRHQQRQLGTLLHLLFASPCPCAVCGSRGSVFYCHGLPVI